MNENKLKLMHISDLHLGKKLSNYSMNDDQEYMLNSILEMVSTERPDALMIAGDVYDKSVPSEDATELFSRFLNRLVKLNCPAYVLTGNHDSGRRLGFCDEIMSNSGVYLSGEFNGKVSRYVISKGNISLDLYMLPYFKPRTLKTYCEDFQGTNMDEAMAKVLSDAKVDSDAINVLMAHQFVINKECSELIIGSEDFRPVVGGLDSVSVGLLKDFDYVALGHLHIPQNIGRDTVRYCGSPLKYSQSEAGRDKSVTIVEIAGKNDVSVRTIPLKPLRDLKCFTGTIQEIKSMPDCDDYVYLVLKDKGANLESIFRKKFPRLCCISFEQSNVVANSNHISIEKIKNSNIEDLFREFFEKTTGRKLTSEQEKLLMEARDTMECEPQ